MAADDQGQNANLDMAEGRAALERDDLETAIAKFRRVSQLRPTSSDPQRYLGTALEKKGDTEAAVAAYRKAVELNAADAVAAQSLERLTKATTPQGDPHIAEFERLIREGKFAEVEPLLTEYVTHQPGSSWGWYALGYSQFAQQKIGASIKALAKSLELDLTNAEAHKILGRDMMIIGRFDAAQIEFEQGIRYKPESAELHYNLGKLFSIQDNWEPARKAFEEAVRIDPGYVEALDALGFALEALGDDAGAVAQYQKAIALNDERHGTFAVTAREPERVLQPHGQRRRGARTRAQGARPRPEVRSRAVSEGQGRRAPRTTGRSGRRAEQGHCAQSQGVLLLLRALGRVPPPWLDG